MPALTNKYKHSIRFWLLVVLIPGIVGLMAFDSWNDYHTLKSITEAAYDNALLEPAKVLETSVEFGSDGTLQIDPPFYAQVMLESRAGIRKYFRVEEVVPKQLSLAGSADVQKEGQTLLGMRGLPRPPRLADAGLFDLIQGPRHVEYFLDCSECA